MNIKKHIPNLITLLNLFCGCIALVYASDDNFEFAFLFVCLGIFLDFFDGFFARMFKVSSPLGLQLDSLADMVTSGVVPGYVMFLMLKGSEGAADGFTFLPYLGFIITLASCYRLAFFNLDTRQTDSFIGLPTPANALFVVSLAVILERDPSLFALEILINPYFLMAVTIFSAYILNAELPLFSLKVKEYTLQKNKTRLLLILISLLLIGFFGYSGVPFVIIFYILLSVIMNRRAQRY